MNLNEMKKIADARTKGPWKWHCIDNDFYVMTGPLSEEDKKIPSMAKNLIMSDGSACGEYRPEITPETADGKFIVMASNNWDKLMAVMDAAKNIEINEPAFHEALKALEETE